MGGACVKTTTGVSALAASTASNHRICSSSMWTCGASASPVVGVCWRALHGGNAAILPSRSMRVD